MRGQVILDCDYNISSKKSMDDLINELEELNIDDDISISSNKPVKKSDKKKKSKESKEEETDDDWLETISNFHIDAPKYRKRKTTDIFHLPNKKKRKKKKKEGELTDYNKEFENEASLYKSLMQDNAKFTDSLQRKYDAMENTKSSARGVGKFTTDLIDSINQSRALGKDLIKEQVNLKKTIAELSMKEREKFGKKSKDGEEDIGLWSSSMLKKMISESASNDNGLGLTIEEGDMDDAFDILNAELGGSDDDETNKYLKYEKSNVKIHVCIDEENDDMWFIAIDENGNEIDDYPLPSMTKLNINYSTEVASDIYSRKYPIIWITRKH